MKITATTIRAMFEGVEGDAEYSSETGLVVRLPAIPAEKAVDVMQAVEHAVREVLHSGGRLPSDVRDRMSAEVDGPTRGRAPDAAALSETAIRVSGSGGRSAHRVIAVTDRRVAKASQPVEQVDRDVEAQTLEAAKAAQIPGGEGVPASPSAQFSRADPEAIPVDQAVPASNHERDATAAARKPDPSQSRVSDALVSDAGPQARGPGSLDVEAVVDAAVDRLAKAKAGAPVGIADLLQVALREDPAALAEAQSLPDDDATQAPLLKAHVDRNAGKYFKAYSALSDESARMRRVRNAALGALQTYKHAAVI